MDAISHHENSIEFTNHLPPITRVVFLLGGLFPLYAPYELLIRPSWRAGFWPFAIFPLLVSAGAIAVSGFFIFAVLFGMSQRIRFDMSAKTITHGSKTALTRYNEKQYPFWDVEEILVKVHSWSDGPATYNISAKIRGELEIEFGGLDSQEDAERYVAILEKTIRG